MTEKKPEQFESEESQVRQHRDWLHQLNERDWCSLQEVMDSLNRMENFCRMKKNMFLPIRDGITEALREMQLLKERIKRNDRYIEHFEYHRRGRLDFAFREVVGESDRSRCTLRGPAQGNRSANSTPHERKNSGMTIIREKCVAWRSERQLQIGGLREAANRVQAENKVDHRCTANCAHRQLSLIKANAVPGSLPGEKTGEF